jgi:hypothetical protein
MSKELSAFVPFSVHPGVWSAQKGDLRCTALKLNDGSLCLYSPVLGLSDEAKASLTAFGEVPYLLAPNHYHHKGLAEYVRAFPKAKIVCSEHAQPRLEKQTGLSFDRLNGLGTLLPQGCNIVEPEGLKTGEVWFAIRTERERLWIVCDSFKGPSGKVGNVERAVEMLGTFPTYGIKDRDVYAAWLEVRAAADVPTMIIPCHGSMVQSECLATDVVSLLAI